MDKCRKQLWIESFYKIYNKSYISDFLEVKIESSDLDVNWGDQKVQNINYHGVANIDDFTDNIVKLVIKLSHFDMRIDDNFRIQTMHPDGVVRWVNGDPVYKDGERNVNKTHKLEIKLELFSINKSNAGVDEFQQRLSVGECVKL